VGTLFLYCSCTARLAEPGSFLLYPQFFIRLVPGKGAARCDATTLGGPPLDFPRCPRLGHRFRGRTTRPGL
jgi:hypothetical protein